MSGILRSVARAFGACVGAVSLVACDSPTPRVVPAPELPGHVISGAAVNGPLAYAEVTVLASDGGLLGRTTTGADGRYSLIVNVPPPYRVTVRGGTLDGMPYAADLYADCESGTDCNVTPFTTALARLVDDHCFAAGDARALIVGALGVDRDPFVKVLLEDEPEPAFDLEQAREFIDGDGELDAWVEDLVDWVTDRSAHPAPPAGAIVTVAVTAAASPGGSIDPKTRTVRHGEHAQFVVTPDLGQRIAAVTGCGGSLDGNLYTTGPLTSACAIQADFAPTAYTVTATAGEGGTIDPGTSSVPHGSTLTLRVRPEDGYRIREVVGCGGTLDEHVYTTAPVTSSCTIDARFERLTHTARGLAGSGGAIVPGARDVLHGDRASFQLVPEDGYRIAGVTGCGGTLIGTTYTTGPMTEACTVAASFAFREHSVTAHATDGGRIDPPSAAVAHGERASFTLTPDDGYHIAGATGCEGTLSGNVFTTGPITGSCSLTASFAANTYSVTATTTEGGHVAPATATVAHGESVSFTLTPENGYHVEEVTGCDGTLSGNVFTTAPLTASCVLTARFAANTYSVTATSSEGGRIAPSAVTVSHGQAVSFTLTPNAGYAIDTVIGCGGTLDGNVFSTAPITAACAVTASFAPKTHVVSTSAGEGGSIAPASSHVAHGERLELTIRPDDGFRIATVSGCGGLLAGETYTTGPITTSCTVTAAFARKTYTITAHAGAGGSIEPGSAEVDHGQRAAFDVLPDAGYRIAAVSGCAGELVDRTYTTEPITAACSVTAAFEPDLAAPERFTAEPGDQQVTLNWDPVEMAEVYDVYRALEPFDPENYSVYEGGTLTLNVPAAPHVVTDLVNDTEYFFSVRARTGSVLGPPSALISATPHAMCFALPSDDPDVCSGNGVCIAEDTCQCEGLYTGRRCDQELVFAVGGGGSTLGLRVYRSICRAC